MATGRAFSRSMPTSSCGVSCCTFCLALFNVFAITVFWPTAIALPNRSCAGSYWPCCWRSWLCPPPIIATASSNSLGDPLVHELKAHRGLSGLRERPDGSHRYDPRSTFQRGRPHR